MNTWKSGRKTIEIVCENCGNEFEKTLSEYNRSKKNKRKHFCLLKCNNEYKKLKSKYCLCCNNTYFSTEKDSKFCSQSCSATYNNKNRKGEKRIFSESAKKNIRIAARNRFNLNVKMISYNDSPKKCKECSNIIHFEKRNHIFCDINCKRKYDKRNMSEYQKCYRQCQFNFALNDFPDEFDFMLIEQHGWYQAKNHGDNLNGVSRDHMISIKYGYENNISPEIIRHPANCQLMIHNENVSKYKNCSITIEELINKISKWELKYTPKLL